MRNQYLKQKPDVEELITSHMELVRQIAWHIRGNFIPVKRRSYPDWIFASAARKYTLIRATFASYMASVYAA